MKVINYFILVVILTASCSVLSDSVYEDNTTISCNEKSEINSLLNCLSETLTPEQLLKIKSKDIKEFNSEVMGFSGFIRQKLGLWNSDTPLYKFLYSEGIEHPESMSLIVLKSFWHHLNGNAPQFEKQVGEYKKRLENIKNRQRHHRRPRQPD